MVCKGKNSIFVVWSACFLWLTSLFAITWALVLFCCVGDMLLVTGTDLVTAIVLLSGLIMLPTNIHLLYSIANCKKIDHKSKVACCPLWLCVTWIIIINLAGILVCIEKIIRGQEITNQFIDISMRQYRTTPKYKRFMDNLQWSLKCCGLNSYKDWFNRDWYDKIRDYEWDPYANKRSSHYNKVAAEVDSVPLSCCKSGSCISNYLSELGTYSINTSGCSTVMNRLILVSMIGHLIFFSFIIIVELLFLNAITVKKYASSNNTSRLHNIMYNVRHIMKAKDNFEASSCSYQMNPDDSNDDIEVGHFQG